MFINYPESKYGTSTTKTLKKYCICQRMIFKKQKFCKYCKKKYKNGKKT